MRNSDVKRADPASSVDPVVFAPMHDRSAHAELLSVCERLAQIWTQRGQLEADLLIRLKSDLARTSELPKRCACIRRTPASVCGSRLRTPNGFSTNSCGLQSASRLAGD
jgi:hypothetical protein